MRRCEKCGRKTSQTECPRCEKRTVVDDIIDIGVDIAVGSLISGLFDSGSSSSSSSSDSSSSFGDFGGGDFGGAGSGGDW